MSIMWKESTYHQQCQTILAKEVEVASWHSTNSRAINSNKLPKCLFVNTILYSSHSDLTDAILESKFVDRGSCFEIMTQRGKNLNITPKPDIIPGVSQYVYEGMLCDYTVVYFQWQDKYLIEELKGSPPVLLTSKVLHTYCRNYCYFYHVFQILDTDLFPDVAHLVLCFLDMTNLELEK